MNELTNRLTNVFPSHFLTVDSDDLHLIESSISQGIGHEDLFKKLHGQNKINHEVTMQIIYWTLKIGFMSYEFFKRNNKPSNDDLLKILKRELANEKVPVSVLEKLEVIIEKTRNE